MFLPFPLLISLFSLTSIHPISVPINCGETVTGITSDAHFYPNIHMFYGGTIIMKGENLPTADLYLFDALGNVVLRVNTASSATWFNVGLNPFKWQKWESVSPAIIPSTGPYTLIFRNNMNKTISLSNETHVLYTFNKRIDTTIIDGFAISNTWAVTSIEYRCNCRAPNADVAGIESCLGLT